MTNVGLVVCRFEGAPGSRGVIIYLYIFRIELKEIYGWMWVG